MKILALLFGLLLAGSAHAASVTCTSILDGRAPSGCAATVSNTASATYLTAGYPAARTFLMIDNEAASGGNAIACTFDGSAAAINTAGSVTIPAATRLIFDGVGTPGGVINCIAASGATAATIIAE